MTPSRERLPNRRASEIFTFAHENRLYTATVSRFRDGRPAEIFLNSGKAGSDVQTNAEASAILTSLALQFGVPAGIIRHAVKGPIGKALECLDEAAA